MKFRDTDTVRKDIECVYGKRYPRNAVGSKITLKFINWTRKNVPRGVLMAYATEKGTHNDYLVFFQRYEYIVVSEKDIASVAELRDIKSTCPARVREFNPEATELVSPHFEPRPIQQFLLSDTCRREREIEYEKLFVVMLDAPISSRTKSLLVQQLSRKYNQEIDGMRWFFALNGIEPAGTYVVDWDSDQRYILLEEPKNQLEFVEDAVSVRRSWLSLDIECDTRNNPCGRMPRKESSCITHIGLDAEYRDGRRACAVLVNKDMVCDADAEITHSGQFDLSKYSGEKIFCNERVMLGVMGSLFRRGGFDIVYTHNGHDFDLPYLKYRHEHVAMLGKMEVGRDLDDGCELALVRKSTSAIGGIAPVFVENDSKTIFVDTVNHFRESNKRFERSNTLGNISRGTFTARGVWNGDSFVCVKESPFFGKVLETASCVVVSELQDSKFEILRKQGPELWLDVDSALLETGAEYSLAIEKDNVNMSKPMETEEDGLYSHQTAIKVANYCLHDTKLVSYLAISENIDNTIDTFSNLYYLPQSKVFSRKALAKNDGAALRAMLHMNKFVYKPEGHQPQVWRISGGLVLDPVRKTMGGYGLCLDFMSEYPHVCMHANISPECIVESVRYSGTEERDFAARRLRARYPYPEYTVVVSESESDHNITVFDRKRQGLLPYLFQWGFALRKEYKKKLAAESNDAHRRFLDTMQYTLKIFINSIYGTLNTQYFQLANSLCSEACTTLGRAFLNSARTMIDNVALSNGAVVRCTNPYTGEVETMQLQGLPAESELKQVGAQVVYGDTDSVFVRLLNCDTYELCLELGRALEENVNVFMRPLGMTIEFEGVIKNMILFAKKSYQKKVEVEKGRFVVENKGTSVARRDYSKWHRETLSGLHNLQMEGEPSECLERFVIDSFLELMMGVVMGTERYESLTVTRKYNSVSTAPGNKVVEAYNQRDDVETITDKYERLRVVKQSGDVMTDYRTVLASKGPGETAESLLREALCWGQNAKRAEYECTQVYSAAFDRSAFVPDVQYALTLFMNAAQKSLDKSVAASIRKRFYLQNTTTIFVK